MGLVVIVSVTGGFWRTFWRYSLSTGSLWKQHDMHHVWAARFNLKALQHSTPSLKTLIHKVLLCGTNIEASLKPWHTTNKAVLFLPVYTVCTWLSQFLHCKSSLGDGDIVWSLYFFLLDISEHADTPQVYSHANHIPSSALILRETAACRQISFDFCCHPGIIQEMKTY